MKTNRLFLSTTVIALLLMGGCATYRTSSNIDSEKSTATNSSSPVLIAENNLPGRTYKEIGPVEVSVKKLTVFNKDPTKEQANEALKEKARAIGADAVINVKYKSGIGMTSWGYIDANGIGVKLTN